MMMPFLVALTSLTLGPVAPLQASNLVLSNVRATHGAFGPTRDSFDLLPGDTLFLSFDVNGLQLDKAGRYAFATTLQVEDSAGKVIFADSQTVGPLGNVQSSLKVRHHLQIATGLDQAPGAYKCKITVADLNVKGQPGLSQDASTTRTFNILKSDFGLVRTQLTSDAYGRIPTSNVAVSGQTLYCNVVAAGFQFDRANKEAALTFEMSFLDAKNQPVMKQPVVAEFKNIPSETKYLPLRFDLPLHMAGQYKVQIKATDEVSKKTAMIVLPVQVMED